ncbi:MAG: Rieske 2Fe-2S domain-containing protein [Chloroflexi bacterium]|nr:Rieske 2Fe-2S domain-containing protein [Chloroflexota bacterium]
MGDADSEAFVPVARVDQIPPGRMYWVQIDRREIVLVNLDGELYAIDNLCLHAGGPLDRGKLEGGCIVCPWHGWKWDPRTGRAVWPAVSWRVQRYQVKIQGRQVLIGWRTRDH